MKHLRLIAPLLGLLRSRPWALPLTVILGLLASLAEGIGLSLFVPLLQSLDPATAAQAVPAHLAFFFARVQQILPKENPLPYIAGLILALTVTKGVMRYLYSLVSGRLNAQVTHELRSRIFRGLLETDQETRDRVGTGRLINLLANDTWHTSDAIALLSSLTINVCSILVFSLLLMTLSGALSGLVLAGVLAVSALLHVITMPARTWGEEGVVANAALSEHMLDAMEGVREIQTYGLQRHVRSVFDPVSWQVRDIFLRLGMMHAAIGPISEILYVSLILGILLVGITSIASVPTVIVFLLVLYRLQPQIRELDSARLGLVSLSSSVDAVLSFLSENPSAELPSEDGVEAQPFPLSTAREITFEGVSFTYPGETQPAVDNVTFSIPAGKITAIVGQSGSGKSTVSALLNRIWEPAQGRILWNGIPAERIDVQEWRKQIAWVDQDAHLFNASVFENIRYGKLKATDTDIAAAARDADADSFIWDLPLGYETCIGTGGTQLSSGQTQRIALARAFLRRPSVLILDEATNGLDSLSEEWIQARLRALAKTSAVLIISHRMPSVRFADQVIVLEAGRVAETGTPEELRRRWGFFSKVYELQHAD